MTIQVITIEQHHDVKGFDCGTAALNDWIQKIARQHQKKLLSTTFVLVDDDSPNLIIGYYALALRGLMPTSDLPPEMAKRLPNNIPALTLARLAVASDAKKKGYGEHLLIDALQRAKQVAMQAGGPFLFVDAKDDVAADFYAKYGFQALPSDPLTLCIAIASIP